MRNSDVLRFSIIAATVVSVLMTGASADAQAIRSSVDRHAHPEGGFFETQRSSRSINHAQDYARDIYRYSSVPNVAAPIIKSESQGLGQTIVTAQQQVKVLQDAHKANPSKAESVKKIDQHLAKAAELQKELHAECSKEKVDAKACAMCASKITKELDHAKAEQEAIIREIETEVQHEVEHTQLPGPK
ncbi:MAG: hypothetical protein SFV81_29125 [Pirellulaceae bacterium]|nr:hypothetical protein [Pirellulaceae bacterium]